MSTTYADSPVAARSVPSTGALWTGRVLGGLAAAFLLLDGVMKIIKPSFIVEATVKVGFPEAAIVPLGVVLTVSTLLFLIPRTALLGAILLTGYLGGAVATHVHLGDGAFPILFPTIFGAAIWGSLVLTDPRVLELLPFRKPRA